MRTVSVAISVLLSFSPLVLFSPLAGAANGRPYFAGIDYLVSFYNEPNSDIESLSAIRLSVGRNFSETTLEAQVVKGLDDTTVASRGPRKDVEIDYLASLFVSVPFPKDNEWFRLGLGVTRGQLAHTSAGVTRTTTDTSPSLMLRGNYRVTPRLLFNVDYNVYLSGGLGASDVQLEALALGVRFDF